MDAFVVGFEQNQKFVYLFFLIFLLFHFVVKNGFHYKACCGGESFGSNWVLRAGDLSASQVSG